MIVWYCETNADVSYFPESNACVCVGTLDGKMDSPQQFGFLHSSYGRRAAQLCHCEMPPVQWTKHCCHPADRKGGGKKSRETETEKKEGKREKSEFIDPEKLPKQNRELYSLRWTMWSSLHTIVPFFSHFNTLCITRIWLSRCFITFMMANTLITINQDIIVKHPVCISAILCSCSFTCAAIKSNIWSTMQYKPTLNMVLWHWPYKISSQQ